MRKNGVFAGAILIAALGALAFRAPRLDQRPMHTDESVHTAKAGTLIETGEYLYDPAEYHGPTIYYFALPFVWISGARTLADTNEAMFRIVPVLFGTGLVLLLLLFGDALGRPASVVAAILTAVSPAMVFYSRYYIQEMPLVFFSFGAIVFGWRYLRSPRLAWALAAGACFGLMDATKETCVIAYAAMVGALALTCTRARFRGERNGPDSAEAASPTPAPHMRHLVLAVLVGLSLDLLIVTNFFKNPKAALDIFLTYGSYLKRADGVGIHNHPWHYYLKMLAYTKYAAGPRWSEALILGLAAIGIFAAFCRSDFPIGPIAPTVRLGNRTYNVNAARFLAFYAILLTIAYSLIPYKTPWCALGFLHAAILLAGIGSVALVRALRFRPLQIAALTLLAAATIQLGQQAYRASYRYHADPRNPYVYGHTSTNLLRLAQRFEDLAAVAPEGRDMLVKVLSADCWPLPWYLRKFPNVGYWPGPVDDPDAEVTVCAQTDEPEVAAHLKNEYQQECYGLRPEVLIDVFVRKDLWDAFIAARSAKSGG